MSALYLRSVELSNFRIYGDSYAFVIPDEPGITLITGANGVGKTSFFDGVEWALTGQVSRFQEIPVDGRRKEQDPLTRIGAPQNSHRVSLQFSDGTPIDRGAGFVPDEAAIAELLKRGQWAEINNLHGYLSITHFLGQSSTQRFSLRNPNKQWEALKGPAGVDRINALRERMSGLGVRRAFTRTIEARTKRLEEASVALAGWMSLLAEHDRAKQLSSSDEAMPPSALRSALEALGLQVLELVPGLGWTTPDASSSSEAILEDFTGVLRSAEQRIKVDAETTEILARIATEFDNAGSETVSLRSIAADIEERRTAAIEKRTEAEGALSKASAAVTDILRHSAQAQAALAALSRVRAALRQLEHSKTIRDEAKSQLERSATENDKAQRGIEALRRLLVEATSRLAHRRELADRLTLARRRADVSGMLTITRAEIDRLTPLLAKWQPGELRARRVDLATREAEAQALISRINNDLRVRDDRLQAIEQAAAAIAHRLQHDDTSCPICASKYPPGQLVELARQQVATRTRPGTVLATELADALIRSEDLRRKIAEVDHAIVELEQLQATMTSLRGREQQQRQQLVEAGGSANGVYDESEAILLERELAALDTQLATVAGREQLAARIEEAEAVLKAETAKRVTLQRARDTAEADIDAARLTLRQHSELWNDEKGLLADLDAEQQRIEQNVGDFARQIAAERGAMDEARLARDTHREIAAREDEARATSNARLDALAATRAALVKRWEGAGQSGDPDGARVAQRRTRVAEQTSQIRFIREAHQHLVRGYRKWQSDEQLRRIESQIAAVVQTESATTQTEVRRVLEERADEARKELELAQAARERIDTIGSQMQQRAESYADEVLAPLNATIQRFARTLMTWSDESIIYRAEHHVTRSELRPGIVRSEPDGTLTHLEMNPNLYFSEGQLSALSVAALLAASTTFGWSRWRALLLDDPLQHNDVIHASAFMDLLRQMVRELGYQVVLSTHDRSEAEFLERKCRSARISYHVHDLVPQGEAGLVSNVA